MSTTQLATAAQIAPPPLPPLSLYVHLPWCVSKCPYCDFNSYALRAPLPEAGYVKALVADLSAQATAVIGRPVVSVFFGGGTPSLFAPAALGRVLEAARLQLEFAPDAEITLEANPGTIERGRFADYRAVGVNRVSLGAQSFAAAQLAALGRIHSAAETRRAVEELQSAGITNFNLDLMYGLPGQSVADALADVEAALALAPAHLSHYQLTLEPGTPFGAAPPAGLPAEDELEEMLTQCQGRLHAAGLLQYEISGYARAGARCRHNLNYWRFGDYLGIGAGAHGKLSSRADSEGTAGAEGAELRIERTEHPRDPRRYLARAVAGPSRRVVPVADRPFEFMMNTLRLLEGFDAYGWRERSGLPLAHVESALDTLVRAGMLETRGESWRPTPRGRRFLNDMLLGFLPATGAVSAPAQAAARAPVEAESQESADA